MLVFLYELVVVLLVLLLVLLLLLGSLLMWKVAFFYVGVLENGWPEKAKWATEMFFPVKFVVHGKNKSPTPFAPPLWLTKPKDKK